MSSTKTTRLGVSYPASRARQKPITASPVGSVPGPAQALVGLALKPGQLPSGGLVVGEQVQVVQLLPNSQNTRLIPIPLTVTTVWNVHASSAASIASTTIRNTITKSDGESR